MAKQKVTTKTTKRFRYSSFKSRIDDLKIEPARNLSKRVHDYVDSSHFLASFEHWKDINLSADFTDFSHKVQNIVQTLPQILYHSDDIFEALIEYISKQEERALQPLLDLLAQFCHDLGPDFMKYYEKAINTLIDLLNAAFKLESTEVFEWGFNCLAYIFKYLSRVLSENSIPTFDMLLPLLSNPKEYLSRFSAEALSFLIRKSNSKALAKLTSHFFVQLSADEESNLYDGLLILFTESLTSTPGSLHSKSQKIITVLLNECFNQKDTTMCITLFCDIWMNISKHASIEALAPVFSTLVEFLETAICESNNNSILKVLSTVTFAESGRKIENWSDITHLIETIIGKARKGSLDGAALSFFFAVLLRNGDIRNLTQFHKTLFDIMLDDYAQNFLQFFTFCQALTFDRLISFNGAKYIHKFIESNWSTKGEQIALYLLQLERKEHVKAKINIRIPTDFTQAVLSSLGKYSQVSSVDELYEIYWKTVITKYSSTSNSDVIIPLIEILSDSNLSSNAFGKDVLGNLVECIRSEDSKKLDAILPLLINNLPKHRTNISYVRGVNHVLKAVSNRGQMQNLLGQEKDIIVDLGDNLALPNGQLRHETMNLISKLFSLENIEIPQFLEEIKVIEHIPLTLQNARDITTRIRNAGDSFAKVEPKNIMGKFFIKYLFGLLTIRFSPVWDGIFEIIPNIYNKDADLVWSLVFKFLSMNDFSEVVDDIEENLHDDDSDILWESHISRLESAIGLFSTEWRKYIYGKDTLIALAKDIRGSLNYPPQIRTQVLRLLSPIPQLAERNSEEFVPFLFNDMESKRLFGSAELPQTSTSSWFESDRNMLLKILSNFKNIKKIYKSEDVFERLMNLLGSRTVDVQKLALNALFCFKSPVIVKYRDNLNNLLDDTLFKDEMTSFLSDNESHTITDSEEVEIMPFILKILYGRAQTPTTSGIKKSRKVAVLSVLPNLKEKFIVDFFELGCSSLNYSHFFENNCNIEDSEINTVTLRRMTGFINIVNMSLEYLGSNFPNAVVAVIRPLLYSIAMSYSSSRKEDNLDFENKLSSNLRQQSLKCLNTIFQNLEDNYNWDNIIGEVYDIVLKPRLESFPNENLQQPSSILRLIIYWTKNPLYYNFLYYDNNAIVKALMETLSNEHAKEAVVSLILDGSNDIISKPSHDDRYVELVSLIASSCLQVLPQLYQKVSSPETMSKAVELLLNMTEAGFIQSNETRKYLLGSLLLIVQSRFKNLRTKDTIKLLKVLTVLISNYDCSWDDMEPLYKSLSILYSVFDDRYLRLELNSVFRSLGNRFQKMKPVSTLVSDLNSYSERKMHEYDFPTILSAFKMFTETQCLRFTSIQWLPVIYNCLYFITDKEELALRTNASYCLKKFVDYINKEISEEEKTEAIKTFKTVLLTSISNGLRKHTEEIQDEYISILSYCVEHAVFYSDLNDMRVLLFKGDEEANFFTNINHIQLHRRQRAIKRLREYSSNLSDNSVSHYLIPIIEHYVFSAEDKYRNLGNEALISIGTLSGRMNWKQYRALVRRYVALVKGNNDKLKQCVLLINEISGSLKCTLLSKRNEDSNEGNVLSKLPKQIGELEGFIKNELYPTLSKILSIRDEETVTARIPLSEALVNFVLGLSHDDIVNLLPGILTKICQILRSRASELRDAVRTTLAKITNNVGAPYLYFIVKELKSALQRGSQVHVLGYTVHHIVRSLSENLGHGDLDESAPVIVSVIMEDIFGSTGQEKDSDNYHTKMIEVKVNRSYDTGEVLASNITLNTFNELLTPIKSLLVERINLKTQKKLEELLRRYALGINHNKACLSTDILALCHEIFEQSKDETYFLRKTKKADPINEKEEFFLVNLNAKNITVQVESSLFTSVMQRFSLDLLRAILSRNKSLLDVNYLEGFIPILQEALLSENEGVLTSALRVLVIFVKLDFSEESEALFKNCARKVLNLIKDSPSTSNDLCQMSLKFLSSFIRHKNSRLKDTALSYVLTKILPDLNEPSKQGLAFNFLKALISKHIMLPELYDVINSVREIMITNHSKEIRTVARTAYYQFLMEYDQSKGRLENQFKFMVDNLQYPALDGRQSVMELINLIITKSSPSLLSKLSSSFFVALANVSFNDDSGKCREMATILLSHMFKVLDSEDLKNIERYINAWLKQSDDATFLNLGLRIYKIYLSSQGLSINKELEELARSRINITLSNTQVGSDTNWDLIYSALNLYSVFLEKSDDEYKTSSKTLWNEIISCLLYPHTWVRQVSARLVNDLVNHLDDINEKFTEEEVQNIASRVLHQLSAPSISESLSSISIKTLIKITMIWNENKTKYHSKDESVKDNDVKYENAIDYVISRVGRIIRSEDNPADSFMSKKSGIQFFALVLQVLAEEQVEKESENIILALYMHLETDRGRMTEEQEELSSLAQECLQMVESKISVTSFTKAYTNVKQTVIRRRQERRAKRSIMTLNEPELAAQKKLRKHARSREKRKHEKDENGFYQRKNKKRRI